LPRRGATRFNLPVVVCAFRRKAAGDSDRIQPV